MGNMFSNAISFDQDIGGWSTSNVTDTQPYYRWGGERAGIDTLTE